MSGEFLLDTNIIIALWANDESITTQLATANTIFIPLIVLGELYYGARKSAWSTKNIARIDAFAALGNVLICDIASAQQYGVIKSQLHVKGRPIPENDIWIAAVAMQYQLTLVSRDEHFNHIDELATQKW